MHETEMPEKSKRELYLERCYRKRLEIIRTLESGKTVKETAELLQVSMSLVSRLKKDYEHNGPDALKIYDKEQPWGKEGEELPEEAQQEAF